jgi:hypothetical protein
MVAMMGSVFSQQRSVVLGRRMHGTRKSAIIIDWDLFPSRNVSLSDARCSDLDNWCRFLAERLTRLLFRCICSLV